MRQRRKCRPSPDQDLLDPLCFPHPPGYTSFIPYSHGEPSAGAAPIENENPDMRISESPKKTKEKPTLFSKYSIIIDAFAHRFSAALYNAVFSFVSNRQKLRDLKC